MRKTRKAAWVVFIVLLPIILLYEGLSSIVKFVNLQVIEIELRILSHMMKAKTKEQS